MKYDVKNFSLDEKIELLTGADSWRTSSLGGKLPQVFLSDGSNGLRMMNDDGSVKPATAMPNLSLLASSWDKELAFLDGETIGNDCIENDAGVLLAPGVNIKRTPLNGRNFEYMSEDPFLAGVMAREFIKGVQSRGIGTSLKHFCANNREKARRVQTSEIDERALNEIYYRPFEIALEAKPWTVMSSYNPVNGVYAAENKKLLNDVLRKKLNHEQLIVSDWDAVHTPYKAIRATLDLIMPFNPDAAENIKAAYEKGYITEEEIDRSAQQVLDLVAKAQDSIRKVNYTKAERHENAVKIAKAGMVLLKNERNVLPLKDGGNYLVVGQLSEKPITGGAGSAYVTTDYVQRPVAELLSNLLPNSKVEYDEGPCVSWANAGRVNLEFTKGAYVKAYGKDAVIIVVGGDDEGESFDRSHIKLKKEYVETIKTISNYNENVIVVINAGSAIDVSDWIDCVKGVIYEGFAGEGANEALSSILVGKTNPSGKLAETFPLSLSDTFTGEETGDGLVEWYNDGIFVGYRYYEKDKKQVRFPFGYGLSYSRFEYENLKIDLANECDVTVSFDVKNVSSVDGSEVAQIYVKDVFSMVVRPEKELKQFEKVFLKAGETKRVSVKLGFRDFAYYSVAFDKWHAESGAFEIIVGSSSQDANLSGKVDLVFDENEQQSV